MNKQNSSIFKVRVEQVAKTEAQSIKLGLDVHADTIVVVRIIDQSAPATGLEVHTGQIHSNGSRRN